MPSKRYFSAAPRVETPDTDGGRVKVFPSSGAATIGPDEDHIHEGPFVWLDVTRRNGDCASAHLTVDQARVIRDALTTFIDGEGA